MRRLESQQPGAFRGTHTPLGSGDGGSNLIICAPQVFATCGCQGNINLTFLATQKVLCTLPTTLTGEMANGAAPNPVINSLSFSRGSRFLCSGGGDGLVSRRCPAPLVSPSSPALLRSYYKGCPAPLVFLLLPALLRSYTSVYYVSCWHVVSCTRLFLGETLGPQEAKACAGN